MADKGEGSGGRERVVIDTCWKKREWQGTRRRDMAEREGGRESRGVVESGRRAHDDLPGLETFFFCFCLFVESRRHGLALPPRPAPPLRASGRPSALLLLSWCSFSFSCISEAALSLPPNPESQPQPFRVVIGFCDKDPRAVLYTRH